MRTFALCCFLALPLLAAAQHRFDYQWPLGYGPSLPDGYGISKLDFTSGAVEVCPYRDNENFEMPRGSGFPASSFLKPERYY